MSQDTSLDAYLEVEEQTAQDLDRTAWRFLRDVFVYKKLLAISTLTVLTSTAAAILEPRLFGYAIDEAIVPKDWTRLKWIIVAYFLVEAFRVGMTIASTYIFSLIGQSVMQDLRQQLFRHLQRLPLAIYDKTPAGKLVTRLTNDVSSLADMFTGGLITIVQNVLVVFGTVAGLLLLNLKLGLYILIVFPFMVALSIYFSNRLRIAYRDARAKLSALNAYLAENIIGMRVVHLFNRTKTHMGRYQTLNNWYSQAQFGSVRIFALFHPAIAVSSGLTMACAIWIGGNMVSEGSVTVGVLVAAFAYIQAMFQPIRDIADKWNVFLSGMASAERVYSILQWPTEDAKQGPTQPLEKKPKGRIVFENVWFAYKDEHWVLRDFSFTIEPRQKIGIVGATGSGKTTLINLLMRFYEPQKGRILIDGRDIREISRHDLREAIGIVQQDVFLFSGTLKNNVTLWRQSFIGGDAALLSSPVFKSPRFGRLLNQIDRRLNERGLNLSMGERQLVAFARVLVADPAIWILDEATANVDSDTETEFEQLLKLSSQGRTTLVIAHRLSTIRDADAILVLNKGALVESGNHQELIRQKGLYALLHSRYQTYHQSI